MRLLVLVAMLTDVASSLKCFSCASADYEPLFEKSAALRHSLSSPRFGDLCDSVEQLLAVAPVETCPSTCISLLEPQYFGGVFLYSGWMQHEGFNDERISADIRILNYALLSGSSDNCFLHCAWPDDKVNSIEHIYTQAHEQMLGKGRPVQEEAKRIRFFVTLCRHSITSALTSSTAASMHPPTLYARSWSQSLSQLLPTLKSKPYLLCEQRRSRLRFGFAQNFVRASWIFRCRSAITNEIKMDNAVCEGVFSDEG
ncbi:hypothetical protein Tcan_14965 [Toxocara canis]|uniref:Uncharacterized protein n=1 Tax=Toxocara canis TaxID=6265 RepID=A0A0B2V554_TOXCA|nr:hypothetical protein Tcan_14965 [Toxocara canis]